MPEHDVEVEQVEDTKKEKVDVPTVKKKKSAVSKVDVVEATWQERVKVEREELFSKTKDLEAFIESGLFDSLEADDRLDLVSQLEAMQLYRRILDTRIHKM